MGSRYDVAVFHGASLARFVEAFAERGRGSVGAETDGPWAGPSGVTAAQIDTDAGSSVVVVAPPMETPRGVDSLLAERLGVEALFATVWDTVSVYELSVVGEGVDRFLSFEPSDDEDGEGILSAEGDPLPEEPPWQGLDEAYIQVVFQKRCGIDPGNLQQHAATWYSLEPRTASEPAGADSDLEELEEIADPEGLGEEGAEADEDAEVVQSPAESGRAPASDPGGDGRTGLWARVKRLLNGGTPEG